MIDWSLYPHFSESELRCHETNDCFMEPSFLARLERLRREIGEPLHITSGYRSPLHSVEKAKPKPGVHTLGRAVDIQADGKKQYRILRLAPSLGFTGLGIGKTFIHLDDWDAGPRPNVCTYTAQGD
jgi:zinc D-Ala-D-Ala carboxypeptidase